MATWAYLDPTAEQCWAWSSAYRCPFCGSDVPMKDSGKCYCRDCDSCTQHWKTDTLADMDEGRPRRESCPECVAEGF